MARLSLLGFSLVVARNIFRGDSWGPPRVTLGAAWVPVVVARVTSLMVWVGPVFLCLSVPFRLGRQTRYTAQLHRALVERGAGPSNLGALREGF